MHNEKVSRLNKRILGFFILGIAVISLVLFFVNRESRATDLQSSVANRQSSTGGQFVTNESIPVDRKIMLGNQELRIRVLDSQAEQELGLSHMKSLPENEGMLFVFAETKQYGFWMKDMHFPIDVVWLKKVPGDNQVTEGVRERGELFVYEVVGLERGATPESYPKVFSIPEPTDAFLEVNAGVVEASGVLVGARIGIY